MNFDWSVTNKKLVIFIPNFGRGNYIRKLLDQFQTAVSPDDYAIVIGNDGVLEDFSDLQDQNIYYFNLERGYNASARNGGFIRNYFIKRCKSKWIWQKDPEINTIDLEHNDFIKSFLDNYYDKTNCLIRPLLTQEIDQENTDKFLNRQKMDFATRPERTLTNQYFRFHWGHAIETRILQDMRGYDEDFKYYGPEDADMYFRLLNSGVKMVQHKDFYLLHMYHSIPEHANTMLHQQMVHLYNFKESKVTVRNLEDWGNG